MTRTDLWKALEETQLYISKYYATALTDEDKHDQLKAYIEKFVLDNGYLVDGFTDEDLVNRLYSEMVEYSILTPYLGAPDIDEINVNSWDDVVLTYSDGRMVKTEEHFHSPGHAVDIVKRLLHHSGMIIDNAMPIAQGHLPGNTRITAIKSPIVDEDCGISVSIAIAFALIPFAYAKRTISYYNNHIQQDLENALSLTTTAYLRTDDIITAVRETVPNLRPPIREIFADFVAESTMISSNTKQALRHLKERVKNSAFERWCDTLIMCQDDRTLKKSLMSTVEALSDVRQANAEVKVVLNAARTEYFMMAGLVLVNIPLLYALNQDWYNALMHTVAGKLVLAVCGFAIIITGLLMFRYTKPIEYRK